MKQLKIIFNSNYLKLIAIIAMTIDHSTDTRNVKKYMLRLGIFAVISHFAYCFGLGISLNPFEGGIFNRTSVMYPLFIAVVVLYIEDNASSSQRFFSTKHPRAAVHMALLYSLTDIGEAGRDPEELAAGFVYNLERLIGAKEGSLNKLMVLFG